MHVTYLVAENCPFSNLCLPNLCPIESSYTSITDKTLFECDTDTRIRQHTILVSVDRSSLNSLQCVCIYVYMYRYDSITIVFAAVSSRWTLTSLMHVRLHCCNVLVLGYHCRFVLESSVCVCVCVVRWVTVYNSLTQGVVLHVFAWPLCSVFLCLLFRCDPVVMGIFHIPLERIALFGVCAAIQTQIQNESDGMPGGGVLVFSSSWVQKSNRMFCIWQEDVFHVFLSLANN